ncbi:hypothetical protein DSM106972_027520 [Dulcicalothrix desertica PCC 7102]|uniref:Uncharacterized protein n=1 Tax=Dulcicalothrix desertica PCC 7102 TaxID=232991 RepID=A0A433VKC3_9CYAN|nr:hypothetical protein [Dulcicalothrix desertica]RUT06495.1 hypothetical protein DSM106972_027520 [Dulcicalothrix desertica PCC 7102]TWH50388.1 hypothetical protein CAL7102_04690 [Dulcicalothrix desertica PCC 7102]
MPRKKPKETDVRRTTSVVQPIEPVIPKGIGFSFRYLQNDNPKFSFNNRDSRYFESLLLRLRDLSKLTVSEIINNRSKSLRCHLITWEDTTEPNGFGIPNEEEIVTSAYQFQISSNEHGRVHGFFIENIFYIVWLDPNHNLYQ